MFYHHEHIPHVLFFDHMLNLLKIINIKNYEYTEERERERYRVQNIYTKESSLLVTQLQEFFDVRTGLRTPDLVLVLEDSNPRNGKLSKRFDFGYLQVPAKQSIQCSAHFCSHLFSVSAWKLQSKTTKRGFYKWKIIKLVREVHTKLHKGCL